VTADQARQAFLEEGASPQLRFATEEGAEACRRRLIGRFPGMEDDWIIHRETTAQDIARAEEWASPGEQ
jgi:hypothetical protein